MNSIPDQPLRMAQTPGSDNPASPSGNTKKILILEDDDKLMDTLRRYFAQQNYRVTTVKNGAEGLKAIMAQDFEVILCDMLMPNLPGDMFYKGVERVKPHLCKRFVFMTGHTGDRKIDLFLREIRGLMVWKPFEPHQLLEAVEVILKKQQQRQ